MAFATDILIGILIAATPLIFAALGELIVEKAGVLNLGVEGMMVIGALTGFAVVIMTGSHIAGLVGAVLSGAAMATLFAILTQVLMANQVASGLALTLFGLGLSALVGQGFTGQSAGAFPRLSIGGSSDVTASGRAVSALDPLIFAAIALTAAVAWFLARTRAGLVLRAVGDNHDAAHAIGYPVVATRCAAIVFGGACAGLGGAYLSLVQAPFWAEGMTAGRGWIALALVVFATWKPWRMLAGAYLFGGMGIVQLHAQGLGVPIDPQILAMLPYVATIAVLVVISSDKITLRLNSPQCLGKPFTGGA